jgi:hypothetical protein
VKGAGEVERVLAQVVGRERSGRQVIVGDELSCTAQVLRAC